ncbi:MAG: hypothetical protein ACREUE_04550 [Panacagrimonas sp.]
MTTTSWPDLMRRLLLVLGLAVGPWPAALLASPAATIQTIAVQPVADEAPCPGHPSSASSADMGPASVHCPCCDDGNPCNTLQCSLSTPAPGLPVRAAAVVTRPIDVNLQAAPSTRPPEPRPGERLRPPIA